MKRKNREKKYCFQWKNGLVMGMILSLVLSLFSFGTVLAQEEAETGFPAEEIAETQLPQEENETDLSGQIPEEDTGIPEKEPAEKETEPEEVIAAPGPSETIASDAKMQGEEGEILASGNCGPNGSDTAKWSLTKDGVLTISGTGSLDTFANYESTPWNAYRASIRQLVVGQGITQITKYAFEKCTILESVSLPEGLLTLAAASFRDSAVQAVNFPKSLTTLGAYAFERTLLKTVDLRNTNVSSVARGVFANCSLLESAFMNNKIKTLFHTFDWDKSLKTVVLGNALESLEGTFRGCTSLNSVNLPASLQSIYGMTFSGCESLKSIALPASLLTIGDSAFLKSGLTSVSLPSKLVLIEKAAFFGTGITAVVIPKSVKSLGRAAFPSGAKVTKQAAMTVMGDGSQKRSDLVVTISAKVTSGQSTARKMASLVNSFRTGSEAWYYDKSNNKVTVSGLKTLNYDYGLEKVAQQRAAEIAFNFSHMRPDGTSCFELMAKDDAGKPVSTVAENIVSGYSTYEKAMEALKETGYLYDGQGHRRNMLSSEYQTIGIGHVVYEGKHYWVQEFGTTKSNTAAKTAQKGTVTMYVQTWTESGQVSALSVAGKSLKLGIGMKANAPTATVTVRFAHGVYAGVKASKAVAWTKSSKTSVAALSGGKVAGKKAGTATLSGTVCGRTVKSSVRVLKTPGLPKLKKGNGRITVTWKKVKGASKYAVLRKTGSGKWKRVAVRSSTKFVDKKVKRGKRYTYSIRCISSNKKTYESNYRKKGRKIRY